MKIIFYISFIWVPFSATYSQTSNSYFENEDNYYEVLKRTYYEEGFPNIKFLDVGGNRFDLKSLKGKPILINYWAFGCTPCFKEMPDLSKLVEKYGDDVKFLSVIAPGNPNILSESLQKKLKGLNFQYTHVATNRTFSEYGFLDVYPLHIVIDKKGNLVDLFTGVNNELLEKYIKSLLSSN
ncbi:TlpA family protein disulfide reductase [Ekhidna sp.]|uniref:TlpA family protein disulfide reductase n=1 Tax=Ekhidna sp. TaxID=2608089 RepID=UPI003B50E2BA